MPRSIDLLVDVVCCSCDESAKAVVRGTFENVYREGYRDGAFAEKMRSSLGD